MDNRDLINAALMATNTTKSELAKRLEITPQALTSKFSNDNFSFEDMQKIANALDVEYTSYFTLKNGEKISIKSNVFDMIAKTKTDKIKLAIKKANMTQAVLCEKMGISYTTLKKRFREDFFTSEDMYYIADILQIEYDLPSDCFIFPDGTKI